jgi:colanic acid biosynthesis glycosyl transferase WcaI
MNILLCGINFAPELIGIGKYTGELAAWLAAKGHEVCVVTTPPYYPAWSIGPGYRHAQVHMETHAVLKKFEADVVELLAKA